MPLHCRLEAVESSATDEEVEAQLDFILEVLIKQSKDELGLIPLMAGRHAFNSLQPPRNFIVHDFSFTNFGKGR